jgi:hypothetical protein
MAGLNIAERRQPRIGDLTAVEAELTPRGDGWTLLAKAGAGTAASRSHDAGAAQAGLCPV